MIHTISDTLAPDFASAAACRLDVAGGKGSRLALLFQQGLPVPAGFVLSCAAYRSFVDSNNLLPDIEAALHAVDPHDQQSLAQAAARLQAAYMAAAMPQAVQSALLTAYAALAPAPAAVAVRSSASAEDSAAASFAGQHESFLHVEGAAALVTAVKECWASLWTARAIAYRQQRGMLAADQALAVVVQRMVQAELAGVLFTCNPLTSDPSQMMLNAGAGLGAALVHGHVTPETLVVDRERATVLEHDRGQSQQQLPAATLHELIRLGREIEALAGAPQDIEWACAAAQVWILQARPITTLAHGGTSVAPPTAPGDDVWFVDEQAPMQPGDLWTRANFGEVLPYPVSPLTWSGFRSWGERMVQAQGGAGGPTLARRLYGRLYANEGAMRMMMVDMGVPTALFDASWGSRRPDLPPHGSFRPLRLLSRLPGMARGIMRAQKQLGRSDASLPQKPAAAAERLRAWKAEVLDVAQHTDAELWTLLQTRWEERYLQMMQRHNMLSQQAFVSFSLLSGALRRWLNDTVSAPHLLAGIAGIHSATMGQRLRELAQEIEHQGLSASILDGDQQQALETLQTAPQAAHARELLAQFLADYGHHCIAEPELLVPRWVEQPTELLIWLAGYLRTASAAPSDAAETQAEAAITAVLGQLRGMRRRIVQRLLRSAQAAVRARDNSRFDLACLNLPRRRAYAELGRRWAQQGRLSAADDIFFLLHNEIEAAATNAAQAAEPPIGARASARRAAYNFWCATPAPDTIDAHGQPLASLPSAAEGDVLRGLAVSPGCVEGRVRIIDAPQLVHTIQPGDIVVTRSTDPSWTPVFPLLKGLVLEIGGQLSHGAIIAREYGLPAVVNVLGALQHLRDGELITLDATNGCVYRQAA